MDPQTDNLATVLIFEGRTGWVIGTFDAKSDEVTFYDGGQAKGLTVGGCAAP